MNNETNQQVQPIHHNMFFEDQPVRMILDEHGVTWFVARDICDILGLENVTKALYGIPENHLTLLQVRSGGQNREMNAVDESGLYRLVLRSDKPQAEPFMEWVTSEILPSIRKTGSYTMPGAQFAGLPMEAMVSQLVALVVPAVLKQVLPMVGKFENQLEQTRADFSYYSSVSGFYHYFCQDGGQNVVVLKDKLYDVYRQYCEIGGGTPFTKSYFCGQLYRAVTGCSATTVTVDGRRIPAIRGLSLLPGWPTIMIDLKTSSADRAAKELADRRQYYFGIGSDDSEA
ncbi:MAG: hypothetical protein FP810_03995 [Desulfocapsa sp.]|nr:hypothetical protein [Desulfocapsa sp.]